MLRRRHAAVPLALSLFLLVGCSDDGSDEPDNDTTTSASPSPTDEPDDSDTDGDDGDDAEDSDDTDDSDDSAAGVPDDMQAVEAAGIRFGLPQGWTVLDAAEVAKGSGNQQAVKDMADRLGVTPQQLEQMFSSLDLYAVTDQGAQGGFLDNVNVVAADGPLPNDDQIRQQYLAVGADVESLERSDDDTPETVRVAGTMEMQDRSHALEALAVGLDDQYLVITVSAGQAETAGELMDDIEDTLSTSGSQG